MKNVLLVILSGYVAVDVAHDIYSAVNPPPKAACDPMITRECDCTKEITDHLKLGLCRSVGGVSVPYRGGAVTVFGVRELAGVDGGAGPPNFDGLKAALSGAMATVSIAHDQFLAQQNAPDAGPKPPPAKGKK